MREELAEVEPTFALTHQTSERPIHRIAKLFFNAVVFLNVSLDFQVLVHLRSLHSATAAPKQF